MAKLSRDTSIGMLHPREALLVTGTLGSLNAEIIIAADGASTIMLDMRGTFSLTIDLAGTVDGVNWTSIPVRSIFGGSYQIGAASPNTFLAACAGFRSIRARVSAYTSGSCTAALVASIGVLDDRQSGEVSFLAQTTTAAAGVAATLTIPAPGAFLRQYITGIYLERHASALLTAGTSPVIITTTNLPGAMAYSIPADAAAAGSVYEKKFEPARALAASVQNTAVTIVAPLTTGVIWRMTATYYVAP